MISTVPKPTQTTDSVLVQITHFGLNRMDISQRKGSYPPPIGASKILGVEFAGIWNGRRVFGLIPGGAYAQVASIHKDMIMTIPTELSNAQAAALPEAWFTALQALQIAHLKGGESILIHAGASGVGTAAIQIASKVFKSKVYVTVGSQAKADFCASLGAIPIFYKTQDFAAFMASVEPNGVNVIIDFIGAEYLARHLECIALDGRMVTLGLMGGHIVSELSIAAMLRKRIQWTGSTLRSRPLEYQIQLKRDFESTILPLLARGDLTPIIHIELPWESIQEATAIMESNANIGKIIMRVSP